MRAGSLEAALAHGCGGRFCFFIAKARKIENAKNLVPRFPIFGAFALSRFRDSA
jgi:hypothetical protein